jgi:hypothetical protein
MTGAAQIDESFESGFGLWNGDFNYDGAYFDVAISSLYAYDGILSISMKSHGLPQPTYPMMSVWIERPVQVPPDTLMNVDVTFQLYSEAPLDTPRDVLAHIAIGDPEVYSDFVTIGQTDQVTGWSQYSYQNSVMSDSGGQIIVAMGFYNQVVAGPKTYFFDMVEINGVSEDFTPPAITNLQPANMSIIGNDMPAISANYSDASGVNTSTVLIEVDTMDVTSSATVTPEGVIYTPIAPLSEGVHNVYLEVEDDTVNHNLASETWSFTIDKSPPTTTLSIGTPEYPSGGTSYFTSATQFALTPDDGTGIGVDSTWYRIWSSSLGWSGLTQYTVPFTVSGSDGIRYIEYNSIDSFGNQETPKNHSAVSDLYLDNSAPTTTLSVGPPMHFSGGTTYFTSTAQFTLLFDDGAGSGVENTWYRIWDPTSGWSSLSQYTVPFTISGADGVRYIEYNSTDMLLNMETGQNHSSISGLYLDNAAPMSSLSIGLPQYDSGTAIYVSSSTEFNISASNAAGIMGKWYKIDDTGIWTSYSGNFTIATEGPHKIYYNATDNLGSSGTAANQTVIVDNTPPDTVISVGQPNFGTDPVFVNPFSMLTLTPTDDDSGVSATMYRVDSGVDVSYNGPFSLSGQSNGAHTVYFYSIDNVGNVETLNTLDIFLDYEPPTPNAGPDVNTFAARTVTFDGSLSTDNSGIISDHTWTFVYNGQMIILSEASPSFLFDIIGSFQVTLTVTDPMANSATDTLWVNVTADDDTDDDGLPDEWEQQHFGNLDQSGTDDPDNDGVPNYQEWVSETDPNVSDKKVVPSEFPWGILLVIAAIILYAIVIIWLLLLLLGKMRRRTEEEEEFEENETEDLEEGEAEEEFEETDSEE